MTSTVPHPPRTVTAGVGWRTGCAAALAALTAWSAGVGWQAQLVSYPLFRAVGAEEFAAYHQQYSHAIPAVVIAPGFAAFLGGAAFWWTRPADVPPWAAAVVAVGGLVSAATTVAWAIPMHERLSRVGRSAETIDSLVAANVPRTVAMTVSTGLLLRALVRASRARS